MKNRSLIGLLITIVISSLLIVAVTFYTNLIIASLFAIVISVLLALLFNPSHESGSKAYADCIKRINQNDLMFDVDEVVGKKSESSQELKSLMSNLKSNFKEQVETSQKINTISGKLTSIAEELVTTMESVASSTEITSNNSEKQFEMLQGMKKDIEDVVTTITGLNSEMDETASYASLTIKSVTNSIKDTAEIQEKMEIIRKLFRNIHERVTVLKDYSEEVISLNSSVNSIADQTSLLALNASIEAARAGEHGKGFAVVATEVSKLSAETNNVSKKIEDVISTLQNDLLKIAGSIEEESVYVDESYEVILKTISDFNDIQESLNNSMAKINNMSGSIKDVSSSGEQIALSVIDITSFSEEITSQMEEASAQVQVQNQETSVLRTVTDTLVENADQMLQNVANKVMEGQMLEAAHKVNNFFKNNATSNDKIDSLIKLYGVDEIYITNKQGVVEYCSDRGTIGLDLFAIDPSYDILIKGKAEYIATPIKKRVEDEQLFKFLSIMENGIVYQVGLSLETLTNF